MEVHKLYSKMYFIPADEPAHCQ